MEEKGNKENQIKEGSSKKSNKTIIIIGICLLAIIILGIALNLQRNVKNNDNNNSNNNASTNDENEGYDKKTYKVGDLYFEDLKKYVSNPENTITVKYNDAANIDGEIAIEENNIYLKYEKDNIMQSKKINIGDENPKYVMVISANVVRYVYILTENGNVYLNSTQSMDDDDIEGFLNFSKINNLSNVSEMFKYEQTPYFSINNQLYNSYGEIAHHDTTIKEDPADLQTAIGNYYLMQVDNDGSLYKKIIKKTYMIGSPESTNSILTHQKQENELFKDSNNENIIVSVLFNNNDDTYLIDTKGNYYKVESLDNKDIKLNTINSKKVTSVDKYSKNSVVQKIEINYSDGSKDTYSSNTSKSMW